MIVFLILVAMRNIIMESLKLYRQLEDMGYNIGLQQCGTICLAQKQVILSEALKTLYEFNYL